MTVLDNFLISPMRILTAAVPNARFDSLLIFVSIVWKCRGVVFRSKFGNDCCSSGRDRKRQKVLSRLMVGCHSGPSLPGNVVQAVPYHVYCSISLQDGISGHWHVINKNNRLSQLKIRVSAVRFCPWPPPTPRPCSAIAGWGLSLGCGRYRALWLCISSEVSSELGASHHAS